ncbi:D-2-hydroxyacid dehydrogenase [Rhizobium grahamii]|uniref:D-isomer specific 2-hydroxyacid dehydrogenase n=1 Tax=Rhizobium grahamii CCGE 502 TaxID=990285 RepID=S3I2I8_9HYPH|nr:D-2-hydroxyacid dehydrogenase [Rhizobium grahamii]EPE93988.1 D-isomer specific 2-hydroxyacid dehydrogenase [Rhizobium grahamii CCGE 502]
MRKKLVGLLPAGTIPPASISKANRFAEVVLTESAHQALHELQDAEGLLLWDISNPIIRTNPLPPKLDWIQTTSVGVETVVSSEVACSDIIVTNMRGIFERPIAEYVLGMLLMVNKDFRRTIEFQRVKKWNWRSTLELRGQTVVLVGPGAIGKEIFDLLTAVGMKVIAVGRRELISDPVFGHRRSIYDLASILPTADAVVLSLPLTAETHGFMNYERFSSMKPGAVFVNIGRGGLVDEQALITSLEDGQLTSALLDVFAMEPLPSDHPFWLMEQVFVSPHMSAEVNGWEEKAVAKFLENLERWTLGKPLENIIDKAARLL